MRRAITWRSLEFLTECGKLGLIQVTSIQYILNHLEIFGDVIVKDLGFMELNVNILGL